MTFIKGQKRPKNAGRKKGSLNKTTQSVKEAFKLAFDEIGGHKALAKWARKKPTDFYKLASKLIPTELAGSVSLAPYQEWLKEQFDDDKEEK